MKAGSEKAKRKLTPRQSRFVDEYLVDLNATQAAIRAGYSEKTADSQSARLLVNVKVQSTIQGRMHRRSERTEVDSDYVLRRLADIDEMDILDILTDDGALKPIKDWPKTWRTTLSGLDISTTITNFKEELTENILKKIKWPDKVKNLELIGKHVDVQAWRERLEHTGPNGGPIQTINSEMTPQEAAAAYADTLNSNKG